MPDWLSDIDWRVVCLDGVRSVKWECECSEWKSAGGEECDAGQHRQGHREGGQTGDTGGKDHTTQSRGTIAVVTIVMDIFNYFPPIE